MEAEEAAQALINALTQDFEDEYKTRRLPKEVAVWLGILEMPRKLMQSADPRIDLIVSTLYDLACSMDEGYNAFVELNDEMEELLRDRAHYTKKQDDREQVATKARQKVQVGAF